MDTNPEWILELGLTELWYRRPVIRQYFHKGLLWRAHENEEVASCELFVGMF